MVKKEEKATETVEKVTKPETVKLMYIGPSLPAGALKANAIFDGTKEEILKELDATIKKIPQVEKMLVPVSELAEKKDKVKTTGNILNKYYSEIQSITAHNSETEV